MTAKLEALVDPMDHPRPTSPAGGSLVGSVDSARFRAEPGGRPLRIPLGGGYILHPIDVSGPWMRVELVRPTVWYFTRGC